MKLEKSAIERVYLMPQSIFSLQLSYNLVHFPLKMAAITMDITMEKAICTLSIGMTWLQVEPVYTPLGKRERIY